MAAAVADVVTAIGMQAGKTIASRSVRDKREAEWLAATIKKALRI
jgi:hypothetical protein